MPSTSRPTIGSSANVDRSTVNPAAVAAQQIRFVDKLVESLDPMDFLLTKLFGFGKAFDNPKLEWTDERFAPIEDVLGAALIDGTGTSVTVTNGDYFQVNDTVKIGEELLRVTAIAGNVLTVVRAQGGTTGAAAANGATVRILGPATPENTDTVASPITRGDAFFNYPQLFDYGIQMSQRQNNTANYLHRTPELDYEIAKKFKEASRDLELTLFHGGRQAAAGTAPSMMGGVNTFITTTILNKSGGALTKSNLHGHWQALYRLVGRENMGKHVITSDILKRVIASFYASRRTDLGNGSKVSDVVDAIQTDFGTMKLDMHFYSPSNQVLTIDPSNFTIRPYKGYGRWHDLKLPTAGAYERWALRGDYTLQGKGDRAHGRISNVDVTEASYANL